MWLFWLSHSPRTGLKQHNSQSRGPSTKDQKTWHDLARRMAQTGKETEERWDRQLGRTRDQPARCSLEKWILRGFARRHRLPQGDLQRSRKRFKRWFTQSRAVFRETCSYAISQRTGPLEGEPRARWWKKKWKEHHSKKITETTSGAWTVTSYVAAAKYIDQKCASRVKK